MKNFQKNYNLFIFFEILIIMLLMYGCEEIFFQEKVGERRMNWYKNHPRDSILHGWWRLSNEKMPAYCRTMYYDVNAGKYIGFSSNLEKIFINYWFTIDSILYEAMYSDGWPNGVCEFERFYRLNGNNILEVAESSPKYHKRDEEQIVWISWERIIDLNLLDSLKQYEFSCEIIPIKMKKNKFYKNH